MTLTPSAGKPCLITRNTEASFYYFSRTMVIENGK